MAGNAACGQSYHTDLFFCHDDDLSRNSCDSGGSYSGIECLDSMNRMPDQEEDIFSAAVKRDKIKVKMMAMNISLCYTEFVCNDELFV